MFSLRSNGLPCGAVSTLRLLTGACCACSLELAALATLHSLRSLTATSSPAKMCPATRFVRAVR